MRPGNSPSTTSSSSCREATSSELVTSLANARAKRNTGSGCDLVETEEDHIMWTHTVVPVSSGCVGEDSQVQSELLLRPLSSPPASTPRPLAAHHWHLHTAHTMSSGEKVHDAARDPISCGLHRRMNPHHGPHGTKRPKCGLTGSGSSHGLFTD